MKRSRSRAAAWLQRPEGRLLARILALGLGAFAMGYLLTALVLFPGRDRPPVVTLPDLEGTREAVARRRVERLGLELERASALVHPSAPAGTVLAQTPLPGQEVALGTPVRVILSAGREQRAVPDVAALPLRRAVEVLTRSGFRVEVVQEQNAAAAGRIVQLRPAPGTVVPLPARVRVVVSSGPPPVEIPNLVGSSVAAASETIRGAGLRVGEVRYDPGAIEPGGTVIAQSPAPGDSGRVGGAVRLTVAGFAPLQLPPPTADSGAASDSILLSPAP